MNELRRHKKSDKIKWAFTCIAFVLVFVMLMGMCLQLFGTGKQKPSEWFKKPDTEQNQPETSDDNGGAVINESASNGIKLMSARIAPTAYAANGISPQADSAYTLTATITPADANNKAVDWSIAWVNSNSAYASGKTVTDYVTVTPTSDGALTANVECKQAFGEQIKVTATSRDNPAMKAECTVDYAQKITNMSLAFGNVNCVQNDYTPIGWVTGANATSSGGAVNFSYDTSIYTRAENFNISVDVDLHYEQLGASPFTSLKFNNSVFQEDMKSAIIDNGIENVYFNESFFVSYLVGTAANNMVVQNSMWTNGALPFVQHLFKGGYEENERDCFYFTVTVTFDGTYSDYTYTTKLYVGSYTHVSDVTGVSVNKSNLIF